MVNINKQGGTICINSDEKTFPFKNSKISLPLNSLYFIIDDSNVVSFKSIYSNYTILTVNINNLQINNEEITKENLIEKFDSLSNNVIE